ncbi:hypothetical protein LXL04_014483 [Taraxacum kok-saghyz]
MLLIHLYVMMVPDFKARLQDSLGQPRIAIRFIRTKSRYDCVPGTLGIANCGTKKAFRNTNRRRTRSDRKRECCLQGTAIAISWEQRLRFQVITIDFTSKEKQFVNRFEL